MIFRNEKDATATARSRATAMTNVRQFTFSFNNTILFEFYSFHTGRVSSFLLQIFGKENCQIISAHLLEKMKTIPSPSSVGSAGEHPQAVTSPNAAGSQPVTAPNPPAPAPATMKWVFPSSWKFRASCKVDNFRGELALVEVMKLLWTLQKGNFVQGIKPWKCNST